ncbi:MAG TPA: ABC transporter ATP-binding protein [Acidimicrobiales bacterium]|jgi:peptide/nickel transport system ATP-binding protein|nr:ABC transporter ATP-binding protein [Acidimicrobiales bacterium]
MTTLMAPTTAPAPVDDREPLLRVEGLTIEFPVGRTGFWGRGEQRVVHAVDDVSFEIPRGQTLGLVGESGSGKTTTGRAVLRRLTPTAGRIEFRGQDITHVHGDELRRLRRHMQLVFQDPYASLNPRMTVLEIITEPLLVHGLIKKTRDARDRVVELLELVGLPADAINRNPHAFSGGQRQRIGIARALALEPDLIVADEPVSALDVSIRAQVVNLLQELQERLGLTYLFIAHDLSVVRHISHRIAIMYCGKIVELADRDTIYEHPTHPYTEALLSAVPIPDPPLQRARRRIVLGGEIPNPINPPAGCRFNTRCPLVEERCRVDAPPFAERADTEGHRAACWVR